jgi:hypothetical protein
MFASDLSPMQLSVDPSSIARGVCVVGELCVHVLRRPDPERLEEPLSQQAPSVRVTSATGADPLLVSGPGLWTGAEVNYQIDIGGRGKSEAAPVANLTTEYFDDRS